MDWIEISINTGDGDTQALCDRLEDLGAEGFIIEDGEEFERFLETSRQYWDYVDDALRESLRGVSRVKFYVSDDVPGREKLAAIRAGLPGYAILTSPVRDEDWENNWRQYYRPMEIGTRLLVLPEWESVPADNERIVLRLDPGLIFGTGSHATTRMCLKELELTIRPGMSVLDLGSGSGILGIAALLLGAECADGYDIDPKARAVAEKNAAFSGISGGQFKARTGDVLCDSFLRARIMARRYDVICANIVADVLIALAPDAAAWLTPSGIFICSGIIEGRQEEVAAALRNSGLRILETRHEEDWYCISACAPCVCDF